MKEKATNCHTFNTINQLVEDCFNDERSFACWSLPNQEKVTFLANQDSNQPSLKSIQDFKNSEGFIIAPFKSTNNEGYLIEKGFKYTFDRDLNILLSQKFYPEYISNKNSSCKNEDKNDTKIESIENFENLVDLAIDLIKNSELEKVVLARKKKLLFEKNINKIQTFKNCLQLYPNSFCAIYYTPKTGLWITASPEILVKISEKNHFFKTVSLAGTQSAIKGDTSLASWTQKEIEEQALVSRYIVDCFKKIRLRNYIESGPKTIQSGSVFHLKTEFEVNTLTNNHQLLGEQMLGLLHPTSAVCGMPKNLATEFINQIEKFDRELYSGYIGEINNEGETNIFVNIRCLKFNNSNSVDLFAGVGITSDSTPANELMESELKFEIIKKAIS